MIRYVVKRFLMLIPLVLCITFVVYGLMSLAPGDPASIMLPSNAPQEQKDALNHKLGYDRPFLVKYADFVYNLVFKGDFGISYRTQQPIINEFKTRLPISVTLAFTSLTLAACIGIPLGVLSAVKQYSLLDTIPSVMALTLSPDAKEVEPRLVYFKSPVATDTGKVILSNSITLTPGTITCGVGKDLFCVHALDGRFAGGMEDSVFVTEIHKLEDC